MAITDFRTTWKKRKKKKQAAHLRITKSLFHCTKQTTKFSEGNTTLHKPSSGLYSRSVLLPIWLHGPLIFSNKTRNVWSLKGQVQK
uniref:Uncharacterized protein n=1 Tax=Anguilla anguilla TaxID=7936 RepID=A0A0E9WJ79_ANGAN